MADTKVAATAENQEFGELLKEYFSKIPAVGDLIKGKVISIDKGEVRIDINGMIVGIVRGGELFTESKEFSDVKVGDEVEATVVDEENENGEMELSFRVAGHKIVWNRMTEYVKSGEPVKGKIINANKGGLMIKVDALTGFMPVSQLSPDNYPRVPGGDKNRILDHLKKFIGTTIDVKVLDANEAEEKLILSEKAVWEDAQKSILESYKVGDTLDGEISALTPFGAFMRFGDGLEGLIHISEIVWQRIDHPKDVLHVGQKVKAQIIDLNKSKIYLSLKRLIEDPWKSVKDRYKVGQKLEGEVHKIEPFGLMIRLDNEIHGLAHISDLTDSQVTDAKAFLNGFKIGEKKTFEIISMEPGEHRLGLRLDGVVGKTKQAEEAKEKKKAEEAAAKAEEKKEETTAPAAEEAAEEAPKEVPVKEETVEETKTETAEEVKE